MNNLDSLQIYNDLKSSGIPEEQAQAQAMAICHSYRVTPEQLAELDRKLSSEIATLSSKIDTKFEKLSNDMVWMRIIGGAMTLTFFAHLFR